MRFNFIEPEIMPVDPKKLQPASYIRKSFNVARPVKKATLHMTALGVYQGFFNGQELGHQVLMPGFTNYHQRVQYQTFDVTDQMKPGENVIAAVVGDGWYRGALGIKSVRNAYGKKLKYACVLEVEDAEGRWLLSTDRTWKASQNGPIQLNDIKTFETVDMTIPFEKWNEAGFDDTGWHQCLNGRYNGSVIPQEGELVLEHEKFSAQVIRTPNGEEILDFGQNLAGRVAFTVTGSAGTKVSLTMGESLDENGNFTMKNLLTEGGTLFSGEVGQKLTYILKQGKQTYKPIFLISGFRYVKLENWPEEIKGDNFQSIAIYSDLKMNGDFSCSNPLVTQLVENIRWSLKSNFLDIPTDCPTRERAGWTGDINVFSESANYLTDPRKFLKKWLHDFQSLQSQDGGLPYIVPEIPLYKFPNSSAGWSDAIANIPMDLYTFYDDKKILEEVYPTVKAYVAYNIKRAKRKNWHHLLKSGHHYQFILDTGFHWGEWLEPGGVMVKDTIKAIFVPDEEVATAWFYHTVKQLSEMAVILNHPQDAKVYQALALSIKQAYQVEFLTDGRIVSDRQCRYVRPLAMGLINGRVAEEAAADLNEMCRQNNYRIGTGFLTTYQILQVLCDFGYVETAYRLLENKESPGWLYEVEKGATTTWENWYGIDEEGVPRDSHNHYAPGAIASWLFGYCAGIRPLKPGYRAIQIKPRPGGSLTWAKASYESCQGRIKSEWSIKQHVFYLQIEVPEHVKTEVFMPDGTTYLVDGGSHEFECQINEKITTS